VTSIDSFYEIAIAADKELATCSKDLTSSFFHRYPTDCCDLISVHLGLVLEEAYPESGVQIVRAYERNSNNWHYWVEIESLVIDLTAYQFEPHQGPLVCAKPNPLEISFPDIERISTTAATLEAKFEINPQIKRILDIFTS
jgi:hypothetical protein